MIGCTHLHASGATPRRLDAKDAARRRDPTGTTSIRVSFVAEAVRRFTRVRRAVVQQVRDQDVLGLGTSPTSVGERQFRDWLSKLVRREVLGWNHGRRVPYEDAWTTPHVVRGYVKGLKDARDNLRARGSDSFSDALLGATLGTVAHEARVNSIADRTYSELENVTVEMEQQMAVELGRAIGEGLSPQNAARNLADRVDAIGRTRAELIARTEIIAAHAEAALESYREAGAIGVEAEVEWATAGDEAVCPECEEMEGRVFSLAEAEGVIPLHPNCRCAWLPVVSAE